MANENEKPDFNTIGMDVYRAQKLAEQHGYDSCTMTIIGPQGIGHGKWLDAYMGLFRPDGSDGFVMTKQIAAAGFRCLALFGPEGVQIDPAEAP